jgi:histone-lysine N-methyltransferase SETMAR
MQRYVIQFFWMREFGAKAIHTELKKTLKRKAYGTSQIKISLTRFDGGDLSCQDLPKPGRPPLMMGSMFQAYLEKYPFASARVLAQHFFVSAPTVKDILQRELGMKKYSRRWLRHLLTGSQKAARVDSSREMLKILRAAESNHFDGIVTGHESWFRYAYEFDSMFARSRADVVPRSRPEFGGRKIMITVFFSVRTLVVMDALPKDSKFNQEYFINRVLACLNKEKKNYARRNPSSVLHLCIVHMDNSMCHNGEKIVGEFQRKDLTRMPHQPYSPDISPCDFWFFGMVKQQLKGQEFESHSEIEAAITRIWEDLTLPDVESVFQSWKTRLEWVVQHDGDYYEN